MIYNKVFRRRKIFKLALNYYRIIPYQEVLEEMISHGASEEEIKEFNQKVRLYLGNKRKYFECEIKYEDGTVERLDWWQYTALKWREEERKWFEKERKREREQRQLYFGSQPKVKKEDKRNNN